MKKERNEERRCCIYRSNEQLQIYIYTHAQYKYTHVQYKYTHVQYKYTHVQYKYTHAQYKYTHVQKCKSGKVVSCFILYFFVLTIQDLKEQNRQKMMRCMTTALFPTEILQDILSFLGKEFYQDKKNKTQIRFIPGIFDNVLGYLFEDISYCGDDEYLLRSIRIKTSTVEVTRPNSTCYIDYSTYDEDFESYKISYYFNNQYPYIEDVCHETYTFDDHCYMFYKKCQTVLE